MTKKNVIKNAKEKLGVEYVDASLLKAAEYNPRKWRKEAETQLQESITRFGLVNPFVVNICPEPVEYCHWRSF